MKRGIIGIIVAIIVIASANMTAFAETSVSVDDLLSFMKGEAGADGEITLYEIFQLYAEKDHADDADTAPFITDKKVSADFEYTTANQADAPQPVSATKKSDCVELKWNKVSGVSGYLVKAVHPWGESSGMYYQYVSGENSLSLAWSFNFDITKDWEFYVAGFVNDAYGNKVIGKAAI